MSDEQRVVIDFDHHSSELTDRVTDLGVGPVIAPQREKCPVAWTEAHGGYWLVTGHHQIREISRDDQTFSSDHDPAMLRKGYQGVTIPPTYPVPLGFIEMDPPDHTSIRKALMPFFTPKAVKGWRDVIEDLTTAFIDQTIEKGECEFIEDIASPVPATLTMMLLGADTNKWRHWAKTHHEQTMHEPGSPGHVAATEEMSAVTTELAEHIAEVQANPEEGTPTNLISFLCKTEIGGRLLSHEEVLLHCVLISAGGIDTTTSATAAAVKWLDLHPDEKERLRSGPPELLRTAIDEFLRMFAPVSGLARTATCPYDIAGQKIGTDERILLMFSAANYDPAVFQNPLEVDLERSPNPHATFGLGAHRCIGQHFAKSVMEVTLRQVLDRMPDYSIDHTRARIAPDVGVNQGWVALPMSFTPGERAGSTFQPI